MKPCQSLINVISCKTNCPRVFTKGHHLAPTHLLRVMPVKFRRSIRLQQTPPIGKCLRLPVKQKEHHCHPTLLRLLVSTSLCFILIKYSFPGTEQSYLSLLRSDPTDIESVVLEDAPKPALPHPADVQKAWEQEAQQPT